MVLFSGILVFEFANFEKSAGGGRKLPALFFPQCGSTPFPQCCKKNLKQVKSLCALH
jgi:hypothetical protein